jgi:protein phosphatase 1 regulatory subunit 37
MCRDILNSCVRNTEEAEKSSQSHGSGHGASGRGLGKGVWGMIEDSELAKTIRKDEVNRVCHFFHNAEINALTSLISIQLETDIIVQARTCIAQLRGLSDHSLTPSHATSALMRASDVSSLAKDVLLDLTNAIQSTSDANRLEELLLANDDLMVALKEVAATSGPDRPTLKLQGLGLSLDDSSSSVDEGLNYMGGHRPNGGAQAIPNGGGLHGERNAELSPQKIDKGKGKAEPEPVEHEKVLSPAFMITEDDDDDDEVPESPVEEGEHAELSSPTLR